MLLTKSPCIPGREAGQDRCFGSNSNLFISPLPCSDHEKTASKGGFFNERCSVCYCSLDRPSERRVMTVSRIIRASRPQTVIVGTDTAAPVMASGAEALLPGTGST